MKDLPSRWFYVAMLVWCAILAALLYMTDPQVATYALAGSMIAVAMLRIWASPKVVPHIRSRWFDVTCLLSVAIVLIYLAPWGISPEL